MTDKSVPESNPDQDRRPAGRRPRRRRPAAKPDTSGESAAKNLAQNTSSNADAVPTDEKAGRSSFGRGVRRKRRAAGDDAPPVEAKSEAPVRPSRPREEPPKRDERPRRRGPSVEEKESAAGSRDTRESRKPREPQEPGEPRESFGARSGGARESGDGSVSRERPRRSTRGRRRIVRRNPAEDDNASAGAAEAGSEDAAENRRPRRQRTVRSSEDAPRGRRGSGEEGAARREPRPRRAASQRSESPRRSDAPRRGRSGERSPRREGAGRRDDSRGRGDRDRRSSSAPRQTQTRGGARRGAPQRSGSARSANPRSSNQRQDNRRSRGPAPRPGVPIADPNLKPTEALQHPPKPIRVLVAGGGTGGHVVPAIAISEALMRRQPESKILIIGSDRGIEADMVPKAGFDLVELPVKPMPRRFSFRSLAAGFSMIDAIRRCSNEIRKFKPDVIVGTGGYVSVAAVVAGKLHRKPVVLQEQNSIPGRANRIMSRFADQVHIHFTESRRHFSTRGKLRLSGNPVRINFPEGRALRTLQKYRLQPDRKTVLILGGSQGARNINNVFRDMLKHFRGDDSVQFIIQTGRGGYRPVLNSVRNSGVRVVVKSFINNMEEVYGMAHLAVARAGAMTLAELCACGLPSVLVPFPYAADDHQTANAMAMADKGAAVMMKDGELSGDALASEISRLLSDEVALSRMGSHAYQLSRPDAARHIAEAVEELAGGSPETVLSIPEEYDEELGIKA